jgi:hypothetical protein
VGTDDGNIQLTTDGGQSWNRLNDAVPGLPPLAFISSIEADRFNKNAAWITVDAHRNGDLNPYVYYTEDLGKTWKSLTTKDITGFCHVIRQDPVNRDLIFLGTESGLFISLNHGTEWVRFKNKVPQTGVYDIAFQTVRHDLILGTHGRGVIIIDDLTALRSLTPQVAGQEFAFLPTRPFYFTSETGLQDFAGDDGFIGPNASGAANIAYHLKKRHVFGDMYLEIYDPEGKFLKKIPAGTRKGINIVQVPTSLNPPKVPKSPNLLGEAAFGPEYRPGNYTIKVVKGSETFSTGLTLNEVQNSPHTADDRRLQRETLMKAYNLLETLAAIDERILATRDRLKLQASSARGSALKKINARIEECEKMHEQISATQPGEGGIAGQVRLRENIAEIYGAVGQYRGKPTNLQIRALEVYSKQVKDFGARSEELD